ncbi:hypothetical protein QZH41_003639 [Actinostola sp. cb2023]|nr:hypothetical protein QZH41_003639 [Actinostola sp. cb2023]
MAEPPSKRPKTSSEILHFFHGIKAVIVENGLGKTRAGILAQKLSKYGGQVQKKLGKDTSHIVVAQTVKYDRVSKLMGLGDLSVPEGVIIVRADWLSKCLAEGRIVGIKEYIISSPCVVKDEHGKKGDQDNVLESSKDGKSLQSSLGEGISNVATEAEANEDVMKIPKKLNEEHNDSDFVDSGSDTDEHLPVESKCSPDKTKGIWICAAPSTSKGINHNQHITDKLQVLATSYANTKDQWRALGYKKAISSIQVFHKRIETKEECSKLPFVGEKLAKKIWEIVETGHLRRLDHIDPKIDTINLFTDVWGAGPKTAEIWVSKGFRTLQDLEKNANLNSQQKIGLKYFDEFRERMPHEEAGRIGDEVKIATKEVNQGLMGNRIKEFYQKS